MIAVFGLLIVRDPGPENTLVLTEAWLLYDEGRDGPRPPGPLAQWDRWKLKAVRLEPRVRKRDRWWQRGRGNQRLLLDDGGLHHVEIGQTLSDSDRRWLADLIREWMVPPRDTQLAPEGEVPVAKSEG
jgi:hypothetical protein